MHDSATAVPRRQAARQGRSPERDARARFCGISEAAVCESQPPIRLQGRGGSPACIRCGVTRFVDLQARRAPFPGFASARMSPTLPRLSAPIPRSFPSARPAAATGPRRSAHKLPIHPASSPKPVKTTRYAYTNHHLTRGNAKHKSHPSPPQTLRGRSTNRQGLSTKRIRRMEGRKHAQLFPERYRKRTHCSTPQT